MGRYPWEGRWNEEGAGRKRRGRRGFLLDRQGVILEEAEGKRKGQSAALLAVWVLSLRGFGMMRGLKKG